MQHTIFDTYELLTQWPDLGPSASWLGQAVKNHTLVSVRFVPAAIARDKDTLRLYHTPAKRLRALDHPSLARVYEANVNVDGYFIISEFVRGEPLDAVMHHALGQVTLELSSVLSMIVALTGALVSLHQATDNKGRPTPVVHGALWPGQVVLTYAGELKLTGSAHTQADSLLRGPLLEGGSVEYEAPEIFLGHPRTPQSNLFSLGVILWELLTGRRLFDHDQDAFGAMEAICHQDVLPPSRFRADCPPMLDMVVLKMLEKRPEARPQGSQAVLRALKHVGATLGLKSQLGATIQMLLTSKGYFDERIQDWKAVFEAEARGEKERVIRHARALFIPQPKRATQEMDDGDLSSLLDEASDAESTSTTALGAAGRTKHAGAAQHSQNHDLRRTFLDVSGKASRKPTRPKPLRSPEPLDFPVTFKPDFLDLAPLSAAFEDSVPTLDPPEACDAPTVEGMSVDPESCRPSVPLWNEKPHMLQAHKAETRELLPLDFDSSPIHELAEDPGVPQHLPVAATPSSLATPSVTPEAWYFGEDDDQAPDLFDAVFTLEEIVGDMPLPPASAATAKERTPLGFFAMAALISLIFHGVVLFGIFALQASDGLNLDMDLSPPPQAAAILQENSTAQARSVPPKMRVQTVPAASTVDLKASPVPQGAAQPPEAPDPADQGSTAAAWPSPPQGRGQAAAKVAAVPKETAKEAVAPKPAAAPLQANSNPAQVSENEVIDLWENESKAHKEPRTGQVRPVKTQVKIRGNLPKHDVHTEIGRHMPSIDACYTQALTHAPATAGTVTFRWRVKTDGRVADVQERSSSLNSAALSGCIRRVIATMKFPKPQGGDVRIAYPFVLSSM